MKPLPEKRGVCFQPLRDVLQSLFLVIVDFPLFQGVHLEIFAFALHEFDQIFAADLLQEPDPAIFVAMVGAVLGINVLPGIDLHLELVVAPFELATHDHGNDFGVAVLESLVLYIDVLRFGPFPDPVPVLTVFRTVFGNMDPEKDLAAPRIETFFFPEFLAAPGFRKLHKWRSS